MDRKQPARRDPAVYRVRAEAESGELATRDDAMLAAGEGRDRLVHRSRGTLTATFAANVPLDGHGTIVANPVFRNTIRLHQDRSNKMRRPRAPTDRVKRTRPRDHAPR
jgi:hypothetical protein